MRVPNKRNLMQVAYKGRTNNQNSSLPNISVIDIKSLNRSNLKSIQLYLKGNTGQIMASTFNQHQKPILTMKKITESKPRYHQNPLQFFKSKQYTIQINNETRTVFESADKSQTIRLILVFQRNNAVETCHFDPRYPRIYIYGADHFIYLGQIHINQSQLIDIAINGFEEVSNVTLEYLRNVSSQTSYCQGHKISFEHVIQLFVLPSKALLVTATFILSIFVILMHYVLRLKSKPPNLPIKDYLSGNDSTHAYETDDDNYHTSSMNIVLPTIENNKRSQADLAISCPMSSFQTSTKNSQIPHVPDLSMSISSDILRLKSFCMNHQQTINDIVI